MIPSPIRPRPASTSVVGTSQSLTWYPAIRPRAAASSCSSRGSQNTW